MPDDAPRLPGPLEALRLQVLSIRQQAEALVCAADAALGTLEGLQVRPAPGSGRGGAPGSIAGQSGPVATPALAEGRASASPSGPAVPPRVVAGAGPLPERRFATFDGPIGVPRSPGMPDAPDVGARRLEHEEQAGGARAEQEEPPAGLAPDAAGDLAPTSPTPGE